MRVKWKGRHPDGGSITHVEVNRSEVPTNLIPSNWSTGLWLSAERRELADILKVKTKFFCLDLLD